MPAAGLASTPGSGGAGIGTPAPVGASVAPINATATVSGGGFTLTARGAAMLRHQLRITGTDQGAATGSTVVVERSAGANGWVVATTATVASGGTFTANWKADRVGRVTLRALTLPPGATAPAAGKTASAAAAVSPSAGSPALSVTIYRPAIATIFGEGFFGQRTACGQILQPTTLGVANRTLPCGAKVTIEYGGHSISVPVIDRGPYANGASWDLTEATAQALGMSETETIGATF